MKEKKILIGITGSIAVYKIISLVRILVKEGAEVKIIMTQAATDFVSPLTFSTISKNVVHLHLTEHNSWINHVDLGRWADIMLIAPLSANTASKMAAGLCDNLLLAVYLSATCPVVVAPAMDEDMWNHPATINNLKLIRSHGVNVMDVNNGELASGLFGPGRMAEPEEIFEVLKNSFLCDKQFEDTKVLVSAGPTYEPLDPVRFIGNRSSGKMGICIANTFKKKGAEVTLVLGPSGLMPVPGVNVIHVETAAEMYEACMKEFALSNIAVMCAAVADYTAVKIEAEKIKKEGNELHLKLVRTKDILKEMGTMKDEDQLLVGFALETANEKANAIKKLHEKNADMIILNSLKDEGAGFKFNTNKITIFDKKGNEESFEQKNKEQVAEDIVKKIIDYTHE